jgi:hypothetical protein
VDSLAISSLMSARSSASSAGATFLVMPIRVEFAIDDVRLDAFVTKIVKHVVGVYVGAENLVPFETPALEEFCLLVWAVHMCDLLIDDLP